jgi:predicted MFS family arabinose efflux permease
MHKDLPLVSRYRWVILFLSLLSCTIYQFSLFSVAPMIPQLMGVFGVNDASAGLLVSIVIIPGAILAIPTGGILNKIGFRLSGTIALLAMTIGGVVTAYSTTFELAMIGRLILGFASSFLTIGTLTSITDWFTKDQIGTAIGLFGTANTTGIIVAFWAVPVLAQNFGWQFPFLLAALIALIWGVLFALLMRNRHLKTQQSIQEQKGLRKLLKNPDVWKVCLTWFFFNLASYGFIVWAPTLLTTFKGQTTINAGLISSIYLLVGLILTPVYGYISDRLRRRKPIAIVGLISMSATMPLLIFIGPDTIIGGVLLVGVCSATMISLPNVLMANCLPPSDRGFGFGLMSLFYRFANIVTAPLIGYFLQISNSMVVPIVVISLFSVVSTVFAFSLKSDS